MAALRTLLYAVIAAASLVLPAAAQTPAGSGGPGTESARSSWLPPAGRSYLGLNLGRSRYTLPCGSTAFLCDDRDRSVQLHAGNMTGDFWGVELGYLDMGRIARGGGDTRARGLNLSLIAKAPVARSFGVFGKVGTTYGRTETSSVSGSGIKPGTEHGFGLSYGAGVSYDFTPRLSAVLEWDSNDFHFAGSGRDPVRSTSLGLQYRY